MLDIHICVRPARLGSRIEFETANTIYLNFEIWSVMCGTGLD